MPTQGFLSFIELYGWFFGLRLRNAACWGNRVQLRNTDSWWGKLVAPIRFVSHLVKTLEFTTICPMRVPEAFASEWLSRFIRGLELPSRAGLPVPLQPTYTPDVCLRTVRRLRVAESEEKCGDRTLQQALDAAAVIGADGNVQRSLTQSNPT